MIKVVYVDSTFNILRHSHWSIEMLNVFENIWLNDIYTGESGAQASQLT